MLRGLPPILVTPLPDIAGFRIRPGIVDFHGDGFERHLAPRRGALKDLGEGLIALDAELAANGITTAYLAQFWSWEGGMRGPDFARSLVAALQETKPRLFTDMRLQLRVETHMTHDFDAIDAFVAQNEIGVVVFNDHLPHEALEEGRKPPRLQGQALKARRSPESHWKLLQDLHRRSDEAQGAVAALTKSLLARGVIVGSHDDETPESRHWFRDQGAHVAEFPVTQAALEAAWPDDIVVLGAPNVMRGGSHKSGLSAREAVAQGTCDILCSDYHYPALRLAAMALESAGVEAWPLISEAPARALRLRDRGRLEPGCRADLTVLDGAGRVVGTMAAGRWGYLTAPLIEALA
ncbi:MAG: alpha-D-ribose 1-methylphosphonate 5-triphosphate diphosphatase [Pseudomonadota bacterium]